MKGAVVYISSNREDEDFENRIIIDMLCKKGDLGLVSVTQKSMELGENYYVGDVGASGFNFCRQLQMAVKRSRADYVVSCEADCLYSPDYFKFIPKKLNRVYRNTNNYIIPYKKDVYWKKDSQTAFQVAGRKFLLDRLDYLLYGHPEWDTDMKNFPKEVGKKFLDKWSTFKTKDACLTIKTGKGMRRHSHSSRKDVDKLPYWGYAKDIRKDYLCE